MNARISTLILFLCCTPFVIYAQKVDGILRIGDHPPALDFRRLTSQESINWADLKDRVIVVEFWATWCPPCIGNIPHMNELVKKFSKEPVTFISVTHESEKKVQRFLKDHPMDAIVGLDNDFAMFKSFKAWAIPMVVLVNKKGRIAGVLHPNNLNESVINEVLAGKTPQVKSAEAWPDPEGAEQYFRSLENTPNTNK